MTWQKNRVFRAHETDEMDQRLERTHLLQRQPHWHNRRDVADASDIGDEDIRTEEFTGYRKLTLSALEFFNARNVRQSRGTAYFFFVLFFVRDAYSLKWSSDVCEYSPTSIK